jgi:hypothetical protein
MAVHLSASTNQSPYLWTAPDDAKGHEVSIRITDAANASLTSTVGPFSVSSGTVVTPEIQVTKPAAGEVITGGSQYVVTYTTVGEVPPTALAQYSLDNGATWVDIGPTNSNTALWNVPTTPSTTAQVRVTAAGNIIGTSGTFSITVSAGTIGAVTVYGEPNVKAESVVKVSWISTGNVGTSFMVDYSTDGQATWKEITPGQTANEGANFVNWTTPAGYYPEVVVRVKSDMGLESISSPFKLGEQVASVAIAQANGFSLMQNYPNPFNPTTTIPYELAKKSFVTLAVYDLMGREVARPVSSMQNAGPHSVVFNAANLASGTYVYKLSAGGHTFEGRMTLGK